MDGSQDQAASVGEADREEEAPSLDVPVPEHHVVSPLPEKRFRAWTMPEERITVPDADHAYYGAPAAMSDYNLDEEDCEFLEKERADREVYMLGSVGFL